MDGETLVTKTSVGCKVTSTIYRLALVPVVREVEVPANPEVDPSDAVETPGAPRWLDRDDISEDERRLFCEKLVSIPWLPAKLRSALEGNNRLSAQSSPTRNILVVV